MIRIDFLAPRTSYYRPDQLDVGLGGNEATLVLWWRTLRDRGIDARVFLSGPAPADSPTGWGSLTDRRDHNADVIVGFRDAAPLLSHPGEPLRMLYTGDRVTPGIAELQSTGRCDLAFVASTAALRRYAPLLTPRYGFHQDTYGHHLPPLDPPPRPRPRRCLHMAAPYRGLATLLDLWPRIHTTVPDAELLVLGGYRLWGMTHQAATALTHEEVPGVRTPPPGVTYLGPQPRAEYARLLASSDVMLYPTRYEEMCCISALECTASGVVPVLSDVGALSERAVPGRSGVLVPGDITDPSTATRFANETAALLLDRPRLLTMRTHAISDAATHTVDLVVDRLIGRIMQCLAS